jgi:acetyl-CoA/propionyl-CoA carboxylase, biotin carboxylase, biotin carboxyl carrier protein
MKKLLIANRGEIAIRIARAARDYGAASVSIYSDADAGSLHVELADEAYGLGPGRPAETYLNIEKILEIAPMLSIPVMVSCPNAPNLRRR